MFFSYYIRENSQNRIETDTKLQHNLVEQKPGKTVERGQRPNPKYITIETETKTKQFEKPKDTRGQERINETAGYSRMLKVLTTVYRHFYPRRWFPDENG